MDPSFQITPPFFEIGPKAYLYGEAALKLARCADKVSQQYGVQILFTPQTVDIPLIVQNTHHLWVFAQHMDSIPIGRGIGKTLPEAIKAAGARGTLLNHAEYPLSHEEIAKTIRRADEVGLATMVSAATLEEAENLATLQPNIILAESPDLIGTGVRDAEAQSNIQLINETVRKINPKIHVLHGAGISNGQDVYEIIRLGAEATGSTSGIIKAPDPCAMVEEMIFNVRKAWNELHPQ